MSNSRTIPMGRGSYFAETPGVLSYGDRSWISVGKYCSIAKGVRFILDADHHPKRVATSWRPGDVTGTKGDIRIGNDVWIGAYVTILSGVTVGDGAIIGAAAVVAKDIPPYAIVVGNPAKIVKHRFDAETVTKLLAIRWWDWPEDQIEKEAGLIWSERVDEFVARHGSDVSEGIQGAASIPAVKTVEEAGKAAPMSDQGRAMAHPRVMFASYRGLDDQTDGMASVRNLFALLTERGWRCGIFTGPTRNKTTVPSTEETRPAKSEGRTIRDEVGGVKFSVLSRTGPNGCLTTEFDPDSMAAGRPPLADEIAAFLEVFRGVVERFRPDVVLTCGDEQACTGIAAVGRGADAKMACWLIFDSDLNSEAYNGCDALIILTESNQARNQAIAGINYVSLPRFNDQETFAINTSLWEEFLTQLATADGLDW